MSKVEFALIKAQTRFKQLANVYRAVLKGEITFYPPFLEQFELRFASLVGRRYGLSFCNGTSAIEAALFAANISEGDEVIVPSCTFHASIDPILNVGATPIFADVDEKSFTINPVDIEKKITSKTKAVIVVHLWGIPVDMGNLARVLEGKNITLIEDVSHAHGARWGNLACGAFGDFGIFSLQGSKTVAAGEGGIVVTDSWDSFIRMSMWGHYGRHSEHFANINADAFRFTGVGYKRRMAPLGALLANADLDHLEHLNQIKRKNAAILDSEFDTIDSIKVAKPSSQSIRGGFYQGYPIEIVREGISGEQALTALQSAGIKVKPYPFAAHHKLEVYIDKNFRDAILTQKKAESVKPKISLPVTERLEKQLILLSPRYFIDVDKRTISTIKKVLSEL